MTAVSNLHILIDSCFWIATLDTKDDVSRRAEAERIAHEIEGENLVVPFPTLYEFVDSRLSRRDAAIEFERILSRPNVKLLPDKEYRDKALNIFFQKKKYSYQDTSLVDEILKLILNDRNLRIDYLVSFDKVLIAEAMAHGIRLV